MPQVVWRNNCHGRHSSTGSNRSWIIIIISYKSFLTWKLSTLSLLGCPLIFSPLISLKLISHLLVFPNSFLKYLTLLFSFLQCYDYSLIWLGSQPIGVIFDSSLTMSDHISSVYKSCFMSIRDLRRSNNTFDSTTAKTIVINISHSFKGRLLQPPLSQSSSLSTRSSSVDS